MRRVVLVVPVLAALSLTFSPAARADETVKRDSAARPTASRPKAEAERTSDFLRLTRDSKNGPLAMEAAVVAFAPKDRAKTTPTVDLISAVHVGEKSYYTSLNKLFTGYDVVLYELVAPEGTRIPKGGGKGSGHPVAVLQSFMTDILNLEFQLKAVDYTRPNFLHADLSPEQFDEAMRNRGESFWTLFFRMMAYSMSKQSEGGSSDLDLLLALFSKNRSLAMKRIMAEQFQDLGGSTSVLDGPDGSAIIADRNKRALEVLRKQIAAGKKKIAIFYGAAHMPDFEKHLRGDFGLVPVNTRWLVAWDLKGKNP